MPEWLRKWPVLKGLAVCGMKPVDLVGQVSLLALPFPWRRAPWCNIVMAYTVMAFHGVELLGVI